MGFKATRKWPPIGVHVKYTNSNPNIFCFLFSWVYRQAVVHEDEEKNIMADRKEYAPDNMGKKSSPQR